MIKIRYPHQMINAPRNEICLETNNLTNVFVEKVTRRGPSHLKVAQYSLVQPKDQYQHHQGQSCRQKRRCLFTLKLFYEHIVVVSLTKIKCINTNCPIFFARSTVFMNRYVCMHAQCSKISLMLILV